MITEKHKLLISSYIDGETNPVDTAIVRELLANSKSAKDYFQGQLHVARRLRQAIRTEKPVPPIEPGAVLREILDRPFPVTKPKSTIPGQPVMGCFALAFGLVIWVGFGGWIPFQSNIPKEQENISLEPRLAKKVALPQNVPPDTPNSGTVTAGVNPSESVPTKMKIGHGVELVTLPERPWEENPIQVNQEPSPTPSEILASPIGPSQSLKKIDLVLPSVLKAKRLEASFLLDWELKGIVRLDLPTYQENEAVKRLVQTLKTEGCASYMDPVTEEKIKRNNPVGPVIIVIHGLDSSKVCQAIQGTSKNIFSKNAPNHPASVFDEVIVGNMGPKEGEAMASMLFSPANRALVPPFKGVDSENGKKAGPNGFSPFVFATISSASALRIPGAVQPRKGTKSLLDNARNPIVINIVPLR